MAPLSILHVFTHAGVTRGGAVQGLLLARGLAARGHAVTCLFHRPFGSKPPPPEVPGLRVLSENLKDPRSYLHLNRLLRREHFDVIHAHRSLALLFAWFASLGVPGVSLVAQRGTTYPFPNPLVARVFCSPRLRAVVAVAEAVRETLITRDGLPPEKVCVVYGSYDEARFFPGRDPAPGRAALGLPEGAPLVVSVCAVDGRKGLLDFARAARGVLSRVPGARFAVVGDIQDAAVHGAVLAEARRLGIEGRFVFTGHRTDVPDILAAASLSVSASTQGEGLTGALRESLAMAVPVVATDESGNPEIVRDGETGWLVPKGSPEALAEAMREALTDPAEARRRAERGRALVSSLCSEARRVTAVERIYREISGKD